jgi:polyisoprenoid-binding protein YceI
MKTLLLSLLAAAATATAAPPSTPAPAVHTVTLHATKVWITGTSNLHDWSCNVRNPNPQIDVQKASVPPGVLPTGVKLVIPVQTLACGNDTMDGKLREALDAEHDPDITFTLTTAKPLGSGDKVLARGRLHIKATGRDVAFVAHVTVSGGSVQVNADVPVQMSEYGVTPPKALLGMLETGDQVVVHFNLTFDAPTQA